MAVVIMFLNVSLALKSPAETTDTDMPASCFMSITDSFLSNISPGTVETYLEISGKTGLDIKTLMSLEMTEVNDKGVLYSYGDENAERMTSKKMAVGAWQIMPRSVKDLNKYIRLMDAKIRKEEYIGRVDRAKLDILKSFGFRKGISVEKIDHNNPEYDADYSRRVAGVILALNRYSLGRRKIVKNKASEGWHFEIRKETEARGFDLEEVVVITHNFSLSGIREALEKGGPENYRSYLPGETRVFYKKINIYRDTLRQDPYDRRLKTAISGTKTKKHVSKELSTVKKKKNREYREYFLKKINDILNSFFFIVFFFFYGISSSMALVWGISREKTAFLMKKRKGADRSRASKKPEDQELEYEEVLYNAPGGDIPVSERFSPEELKELTAEEEVSSYPAVPVKGADTGGKDKITDKIMSIKNAGMRLCPPVERYTVYVPVGFCSGKEFREDKMKYAGRFDLRYTRKDDPGRIAEYVLEDILNRGVDPDTVIVSLPALAGNDKGIAMIEKIRDAGIRFIILDINGFKSEFPEKQERDEYRENIYALMLLVRKLSGETDDPVLINILRSLVSNYTARTRENDNQLLKRYVTAILTGDVSELIKFVLIYRPMKKIVDEQGERLNMETLIFA
jgi:hypothetical protein